LPQPTAERSLHRPENEVRRVWKYAAMKEAPVHSLPFKTTRFIEAVKKTRRFKMLVRASPNAEKDTYSQKDTETRVQATIFLSIILKI
jgi:hypothetical protein